MSENHICQKPAKAQRDSGIELLRIIAMLLIVFCHFVYWIHRGYVESQPLDMNKLFLQSFSQGKVGVICFFSITAWFLCGEPIAGSLRRNWRRVWILEREVLFWSWVLYFMTRFVFNLPLNTHSYLLLFFPLSSSVWWYITSYAIFMLLCPFLTRGLKSLTQKWHAALCLIILVLWGVMTLIPGIDMNLASSLSVGVLLVLYPIIAYVKWYIGTPSMKAGAILLIIGFSLIVISYLVLPLYGTRLSIPVDYYADHSWRLPVFLSGFGLMIIFLNLHFHSKIINYIAGSTVAVYLISAYPSLTVFAINMLTDPISFWSVVLAVLIIFIICLIADCARRAIFAVTIDRNKGRLFDRFWLLLESSFIVQKILKMNA